MHFGKPVQEKIARVIADHFTTQQIESVRKIDALIDMRANGELDEQEFRGRKEMLLTEKNRLEAFIRDTEQRVENWLEIAERGFNFAEKAAIVFARAQRENDPAVKKAIFSALGSDYTLEGKKLKVSLDNLLFPIRECAKEVQHMSQGLEPRKKLAVAKDMDEIYAQNPRLLAVSGWNRGRSSLV